MFIFCFITIAALVLLRQMSRNINILVIKKQTESERLRAIFAERYHQLGNKTLCTFVNTK